MKKIYLNCLLITLIFAGFQNSLTAQKNIDTLYSNYTKLYQEVVYAHLNKSKYVKGDMLGFTAYVFDKKKKVLSNNTSNLYCVITDTENNVVLKKLVKVENGIAYANFMIADSLKSGSYIFKSYTNWMRNFSQNNYYAQNFEVIGAEKNNDKKIASNFYLDAQFLPESGHLLHNVINTVGVAIKDTLGFGVANIDGKIYDDQNNFITSFQVNKNGIGRFSFIPKFENNYKAKIKYKNKDLEIPFSQNVEKAGVLLKVAQNKENAIVSVVTNSDILKNKKYLLTFHDGKNLNNIDINFDKEMTITKKIPFKNLSKGITIFTLFTEDKTPVAERLFFNHQKIKIIKSENFTKTSLKDTLYLSAKYDSKDTLGFNNVSVSVLPATTKSYQKNSNIISQVLLQPYIKGAIENANYYFTDINEEKMYELDNLLITQGWSSYNWNSIFTNDNKPIYEFEKGISINVNIPKTEKNRKFFIHNLSNRPPQILEFTEEIKSFNAKGYFPINDEKLFISKINKSGNIETASLYIQYSPNDVPNLKTGNSPLLKPDYYEDENYTDFSIFEKLNKKDVLNEVVIKANLEKKRILEIKRKSMGNVYFPSDLDKNFTLAQFLNFKPGITAEDDFSTNTFRAYNRIAQGTPAVYLDGFLVMDSFQLFSFNMQIVDYIEINLLDASGGSIMGVGGSIKIFTDPYKYGVDRTVVSDFEFPISFSSDKKFYVPQYENYNGEFYKNYGVIDWLPANKIDENGNLNFSFYNPQKNDIKLFIEGVTEDGTFVFEEKLITLN
ncbi:MAG: hypothetical protein WAO74_04310 [Polaribacter sp.]|uniref:hypothetical protein n=1 Tax=Polaribacter sp. TaxID=1920175 RepID=UPI003BAF4125